MINKSFIYKYFVPSFVKEYRRKKRIRKYPIIKNVTEAFPVLFKAKEESWDEMWYPSLYKHNKEYSLLAYSPALYTVEIPNAVVSCYSDVVITDKGVYWDKFNDEEFITFGKPADANVIAFDSEYVSVLRNSKNNESYISGNVISLIGTDCYHWEHFLVQYASKMYFAGENGILDHKITILYFDRGDACIRQFIEDYVVDRFPNVSIMKAEEGIDYICEKLVTMPSTTPRFNGYKYRLDWPYMIPNCVLKRIDKYVVEPYIEKIKNNKPRYKKIFLGRKGMRRTLINYDEIHDYFKSNGFVDIEGGNLSLEQKADIFYHAEEIVGVLGGAEENLIFCHGAKCMFFVNYYTSATPWGFTQAKNKVKCWINVAGKDEEFAFHSSFTIPLEKVKRAYKEYINDDESNLL